jgi:hypothetical protein
MKKNVIIGTTKVLRLHRETLLNLGKNDLRIVGGVEAEVTPLPPSVKFCTEGACTTTTGG